MLIYLVNDAGRVVLGLTAIGAFILWYAAADSAWKADVRVEQERVEAEINSEAARRMEVLYVLRDHYRMTHDGISTDIHLGKAWPPAAWLNEQLAAQFEHWTVATDGGQVTWTDK